jgi:hypothetical protein
MDRTSNYITQLSNQIKFLAARDGNRLGRARLCQA